jgi:large subunit ribosomal protein L37e
MGTASLGKAGRGKAHITCRRCGKHSYNAAHEQCASCGFGKTAKLRRYRWQKKRKKV